MPVKKKAVTSTTKSKSVLFKKEIDTDALKEKIVECRNKDEYIHDLMEQLEDMKIQISALQEQKHDLENSKQNFDEQLSHLHKKHTKNIVETKDKYESTIKKIFAKINMLHSEIEKSKSLLNALKLEYLKNAEEFKTDLCSLSSLNVKYMQTLQEEMETKEEKVQKLNEELQTITDSYVKLKSIHSEEIKLLTKKHEEDIRDLEFGMLETITELRNLLDRKTAKFDKKVAQIVEKNSIEVKQLHKALEDETNKLKREYEAKIRQIEENCSEVKIFTEIQCTESCKDIEETWKLKLAEQEKQSEAILKECQAISEYNIIQCELEKQQIQQELSEKIQELETFKQCNDSCTSCKFLNDKYSTLEIDLNKMIQKLTEDHEILEIELNMYKTQLDQVLCEKKIYEITINKTHNTIEALKNRLLESDRDVEQLKRELEKCEMEKLKYEGKSYELFEELHIVLKLYEDLEIQQEKNVLQTKDHIADVEKELREKVDAYKDTAGDSINSYAKTLKEKEKALNSAITEKLKTEALACELREKLQQKEIDLCQTLEQLHEQQQVTADVQLSIGDAVQEFDHLEHEYNTNITKLQSIIKKKDEQINGLQSSMRQLQGKANKTDEIEDLNKQLSQLRDKSNSYFQYCEYYKNKAAEYEEEIADLSKINKKYIDQSGKYDALLQKCETLQKRSAELEEKVR